MSTVANDENSKKRVPYGAVSWYEQFLSLAQRIQISKVDNEFLQTHTIAITNERKFISGLKALRLIDSKGNSKENMSKLRVVGDAYRTNLKDIVKTAYSELLSKIDIEQALSDDVINTIIMEYGASRKGAKQAARIFIYLADESEIQISSDLAILRRKTRGKQRITSQSKGKEKKEKIDEQEKIPEGMHKISWGDDITMWLKKGDKKVAEKAIALINLYLEDVED